MDYFSVTDYLIFLLMAVCIFTDIKSRKIYNKVLIPFLLAGLAANILTGGWPGLVESAAGFLVVLVLLIIPFAKGGIGGGDVKLLAVIGSIKGPAFVLGSFLAGAIAGGVLALALLIRHRRLLNTLAGAVAAASGLLSRYGIPIGTPGRPEENAEPLHLPYSLAIGAGVVFYYCNGMRGVLG